jgi:hypothetical protein
LLQRCSGRYTRKAPLVSLRTHFNVEGGCGLKWTLPR